MEIFEVEKLLIGTQYEPFIGTFQRISLKEYLYDNLFKIGNDDLGYFVLKLRQEDERNVISSLNLLGLINDSDKFMNDYSGIIEREGFILIISEWLKGIQPIDCNRDVAPKPDLPFFRQAYKVARNCQPSTANNSAC